MSQRTALAMAWTVLILVICWIPGNFIPPESSAPPGFGVVSVDKMIHVSLFAAFAWLWMRVGLPMGRADRVLAFGLTLAIVTEIVQGLAIIGRNGNVADALADTAGLAIGVVTSRTLGI